MRGEAPGLDRRQFLRASFAAGLTAGTAAQLATLRAALASAPAPARQKRLILLWMEGGPSQLDTFDPKPGSAGGGPFGAIRTAADGIRIAEHLPKLAREMKSVALIRTMTSREGNHPRARYLLQTGYAPGGAVHHPGIGSVVAHELGPEEAPLPSFVSLGGFPVGSGFLGPQVAPFQVQDPGRAPPSLHPPGNVDGTRAERRLALLAAVEHGFGEAAPEVAAAHGVMRARALRMMRSEASAAFDIAAEPGAVREAYGDDAFGRAVLVARRLVEAGVPAVQVTLKGWDTHQDNFARVQALSGALDRAMAGLIADLRARGLLDETLVVWMGEFGRTPVINERVGRDHFPRAYTVALAGAGLRGGVAVGETSEDGKEIRDRPVTVPELFATIYRALGVDLGRVFGSPEGRPVPIIAQGAAPIRELI